MYRYVFVLIMFSVSIFAEEIKKEEPVKVEVQQAQVKEKQKAQHIFKNLEDTAMKKLQEMMAAFDRFSENKDEFIAGKIDYATYKSNEKKAADQISLYIDFYDVCEKSLKYEMDSKTKKFKKDHWKGKTQQQKDQFAGLFKKLIEVIVYPATIEFFGKLKVEHSVVKNDGKEAALQSIIYYKKKDAIMEWYMHKTNNGTWIVYDIGIEGERWVTSFRSQFNDVISKKSYNELLKMMTKKYEETVADNDKKDKEATNKNK